MLGAPELVDLYQCFPYCGEPVDPPPPPIEPFTVKVMESSTPDVGTGVNAGVAGATVTMSGDRNGTTTFPTDGSGNVSGTYSPEATPTFYATKWGMNSGTGGPGSTLMMYTDTTQFVGLEAGGAPAAYGQSWNVTASAAGGSGTIARSLGNYPSVASFTTARSGDSPSAVSITKADHKRFTWYGEAGLSLSATGPIGGISSTKMRFKPIHKFVHVALTLKAPPNEEVGNLKITLTPYDMTGDAKPIYGTPFFLPAAETAAGPRSQSNPLMEGDREFWVWSLNRLGSATQPYHQRFWVHVENDMLISLPDSENELVDIKDEHRYSGEYAKSIKLIYKNGQK